MFATKRVFNYSTRK